MSEREKQIAQFLAAEGLAAWQRVRLAGDASGRRYERLGHDGRSVILMDSDPGTGQETAPFARIAGILADEGLSPPDILAHEPEAGLMIISDLGPHDFAKWLANRPDDGEMLYKAAVDVLVRLKNIVPPPDLPILTPDVGGAMLEPLFPHYTDAPIDDLSNAVTTAMSALLPPADTLALRDYHAENLIWRPDLTGTDRVGLLDFQDAFVAPAPYDLASLIRDVRRDVSVELVEKMMQHYARALDAGDDLKAQVACIGAQRNLRILGIFARLARTLNKPRYIDLIPRVWRNLQLDLNHPALADVKRAAAILPPPEPAFLTTLRT